MSVSPCVVSQLSRSRPAAGAAASAGACDASAAAASASAADARSASEKATRGRELRGRARRARRRSRAGSDGVRGRFWSLFRSFRSLTSASIIALARVEPRTGAEVRPVAGAL